MSRHAALLRNDQTQHTSYGDSDSLEPYAEGEVEKPEPTPAEIAANEAAEARKSQLLAISFFLMLIFGLGNRATHAYVLNYRFHLCNPTHLNSSIPRLPNPIQNSLSSLFLAPITSTPMHTPFIPSIELDYIGTYPLFLSLVTTCIYIPASFIYIIPIFYLQKKPEHDEQRAIPMKTWILIGGLDSLAGIMQILTINIIKNGTLIVLLSQTAIPISMICSRFFLGTKYQAFHYIGVSIVLAGLLIVLIPRFFKKNDDPDPDQPDTTAFLIAIAVLVASNIPQCLSTVYKEISLADTDVDPIFLNGWVAIWQFLISFPLLIPSAYTEGIPIKEIPRNLFEGAKCWFGINSYTAPDPTDAMIALGALYYAGQGIALAANQLKVLQRQINDQIPPTDIAITTEDENLITKTPKFEQNTEFLHFDGILSTPFASSLLRQEVINTIDENGQSISTVQVQKGRLGKSDRKSDNCGKAPIFTNLYMAFNIVYNILIILLIKYGSANLLFMCLTITLPLSSVFFSLHLPFIKSPKAFTKYDIIGLIVLLSGIIIYRFWKVIIGIIYKEKKPAGEDQEQLLTNGNSDQVYGNVMQYRDSSTNNTNYQKPINGAGYYGEVNASVDDPFGDQDSGNHDGYETAEVATHFTNSSSNASDTTNHGRKKVKKGRK